MTPKEIIAHEPKFFPEIEDWNAFVELANQRGNITHEWLKGATSALRDYLAKNIPNRWSWTEWGNATDTKLYITEFGQNSLFLGFGWDYGLYLYLEDLHEFKSDQINILLKSPEFNSVINTFERVELDLGEKVKAMNSRNFYFGSPYDGCIPVEELAWYAGNRTDEFVQQAVDQLEAFTKNEEITDLIYELNKRTKN